MYEILLKFHSLLRWLALLFIVAAFLKSLIGMAGKQRWSVVDNKLSIYSLVGAHLQLVIGLVLYFLSPVVQSALEVMKSAGMGAVMKDATLRFWLVEHFLTMLIAIVLVTIGRVKAKKAAEDAKKHKYIVIFFFIALLLILSRIPWPWMEVARPLWRY
ncbi:hypothetical protein AB9P05_12180 [Roseivirga sp. BDSF3-8]|uniref:hypothetical protein n=1 Tax=Roseivirga sp. BDSF3-8 TaxID=3241598 RepID=UPI00353264A7